MEKRSCCGLRVCLVCGALLIVFGVFLLAAGPPIMTAIIHDKLPMKDRDSLLFKIWRDSTKENLPLIRHFYFWNLTNPYEVFNRTEVPNFVKIGPYAYREHLYSPDESISWSTDKSKIHFNYFSDLTWDNDLSVDPVIGQLHENDTFTTINLALFAAAYRLNYFPTSGEPLIADLKQVACDLIEQRVNNTIVGNDGFFVQRPIHDYLFGFTDDVWKMLQDVTFLMEYNNPSVFKMIFNHSQPAPSPYTYRTGLTCPLWDNESICNSSGHDRCTISSGTEDIKSLAQYEEWAGQSKLWWWGGFVPDYPPGMGPTAAPTNNATTPAPTVPLVPEGATCQDIRGSNAMNYPPGLSKTDSPAVFVDDIFRSVSLQFKQEVTVKRIPTLQFTLSDSELRTDTPNAQCYDQRYPAIFNLTRPYFAPMLVTQPAFYGLKNVDDVKLVEDDVPQGQRNNSAVNFTVNRVPIADYIPTLTMDDSELILRIEPHTGALMEGRGRIQMATWLRPMHIDGCPNFFPQLQPKFDNTTNTTSHFPYTMMPIVYLDRTVIAPDNLADLVFSLVVLPFLLLKVVGGVSIGGGSCLAIGALVYFRRNGTNGAPSDTPQETDALVQ